MDGNKNTGRSRADQVFFLTLNSTEAENCDKLADKLEKEASQSLISAFKYEIRAIEYKLLINHI